MQPNQAWLEMMISRSAMQSRADITADLDEMTICQSAIDPVIGGSTRQSPFPFQLPLCPFSSHPSHITSTHAHAPAWTKIMSL